MEQTAVVVVGVFFVLIGLSYQLIVCLLNLSDDVVYNLLEEDKCVTVKRVWEKIRDSIF
jgi:hypothetical protein